MQHVFPYRIQDEQDKHVLSADCPCKPEIKDGYGLIVHGWIDNECRVCKKPISGHYVYCDKCAPIASVLNSWVESQKSKTVHRCGMCGKGYKFRPKFCECGVSFFTDREEQEALEELKRGEREHN